MLSKKKAQSTLEYALLIAAVVGALLAINIYMKRGVQGRLKESTDQIGKQFDGPQNFTSAWKSESIGTTTTTENRTAGSGTVMGNTTSAVTAGENITRSETEKWGTEPTAVYTQ